MKTKLEDVKKHELIEMFKSLWIEKRLKSIENRFSDNDKRIDELEKFCFESVKDLDYEILNYFGYE